VTEVCVCVCATGRQVGGQTLRRVCVYVYVDLSALKKFPRNPNLVWCYITNHSFAKL
jgi:hypothetical protein